MSDVRREEDRLFWTMFDASPDPMAVIRVSDETFLDINEAFESLFGRQRAQMLGQVAPNPMDWDVDRRETVVAQLATDGRSGPWDIPLVLGPGQVRSCSFSAVRVEISSVPCNLTHFRDVTELREAQTAAREQAERWTGLVAQLPGIAWTVDADERYTAIAGRALPPTTDPSTLIGLRIDDPMQSDREKAVILDAHRRALQGMSVSYDAAFFGVPYACRISPMRDGQGNVIGAVGFALDITERAAAEDHLRRFALRVERLSELSQAILAGTDLADIAGMAADAIRELTGCDRASILRFDRGTETAETLATSIDDPSSIGRGYRAPLGQSRVDAVERAEEVVLQDLAAEGDRLPDPLVALRTEGIRSFALLPLVADAEVLGAVTMGWREADTADEDRLVVARDYATRIAIALRQEELRRQAERYADELRTSYAQLRDADHERRRLLGETVRAQEEERRRISHDIHDDSIQKMAAVALRLDVLRHSLTDPKLTEQVAELISVVHVTLDGLRHLLFDLWPSDLEGYGLGETIRGDLAELSRSWPVDLALEGDVTDDLPVETRIVAYRIIQEALSNARRHSEASKVRVDLRNEQGGLWAAVADDGVGIPTETADASPPGHLGLTTMRQRAEVAGGWLTVQPGKRGGTVVEFFLPAEPGSALSEASDPADEG